VLRVLRTDAPGCLSGSLCAHLHLPGLAKRQPFGHVHLVALLQGFTELVHHAGLEDCVVLVDGVDELPVISSDPTTTVAFLASLLGMLPLIECPGWAFKFFFTQELEQIYVPTLVSPDDCDYFGIAWNAQGYRTDQTETDLL